MRSPQPRPYAEVATVTHTRNLRRHRQCRRNGLAPDTAADLVLQAAMVADRPTDELGGDLCSRRTACGGAPPRLGGAICSSPSSSCTGTTRGVGAGLDVRLERDNRRAPTEKFSVWPSATPRGSVDAQR